MAVNQATFRIPGHLITRSRKLATSSRASRQTPHPPSVFCLPIHSHFGLPSDNNFAGVLDRSPEYFSDQILVGLHDSGMGVVTVSSSATGSPVGLNSRYLNRVSLSRRPVVVAFKSDKSKKTALVGPREPVALPVEVNKENVKRIRKAKKRTERVNAVTIDEARPSILDLDYGDAAAKLENLFKISPIVVPDEVLETQRVKRRQQRRKRSGENEEKGKRSAESYVRSQRKGIRLSLEKRIALRTKNEGETVAYVDKKKKNRKDGEDDKINRLIREYSSSTDMGSYDWKKMKIPPVLSSSEHTCLFKLMQPMKEILRVRDMLGIDLKREVKDDELAVAMNTDVVRLRRQLEVGRAARSKLIKHNLRLVLFVMNKYFQDFTNSPRFEDLCQVGVKGLIMAIDRFEPKRKFRLSTYGLFWIRHAIIRYMTVTSFNKVSFGLESVRLQIKKAKLELLFELKRQPTDEEIIARAGISHERYHDVKRASMPIYSLNARHWVTNEEFINGLTDVDGVDGGNRRQPAILRLALDDVLDSLKPKESLSPSLVGTPSGPRPASGVPASTGNVKLQNKLKNGILKITSRKGATERR
ncbi:RNA polymerase sigma factor sigE-chloroplastic/mitochondrial [Striga hermonthica]|uniref:RNA polymerase sigma factor sigE-chloroplastic/mitochondrial n=1 Tax=Striga hermonthica TaxID=68872 RepID=A0A9N7MQM5_STRHE|nr:RNA polymerase sigma factor sigE-chloroplastic/mitochondrial [Striga hermonthica]